MEDKLQLCCHLHSGLSKIDTLWQRLDSENDLLVFDFSFLSRHIDVLSTQNDKTCSFVNALVAIASSLSEACTDKLIVLHGSGKDILIELIRKIHRFHQQLILRWVFRNQSK